MDASLLPDLLVFAEAVRAGSVTAAAERLHTVQSNASMRIKLLERALGTTLLRRHARGVTPTPAGEAALAVALRADALLDELRGLFGKPRTLPARLRLGAIETIAATELPSLVSRYVRAYGPVDVSVQAAGTAVLLKALRNGELDAVFVSRRPGPDFDARVAFRHALVVAAPRGSGPLRGLLAGPGPALKILVQRHGCSYTERLLRLCEQAGRDYRLLEIGTLEGILGFVDAGIGVAVMPRTYVAARLRSRNVELQALPAAVRGIETYLVTPRAGEPSPSVAAFVKLATADLRRRRR